MNELQLKYGTNPNQKPARIFMADGKDLPIEILSGKPGYINLLDAFNSYQLVKEIKKALGMPAATSFKHVSPTSAAVGLPLSDKLKKACFVDDVEDLDSSPLACAYARARGTDRMSSFGDFIALSDECDETTAKIIASSQSRAALRFSPSLYSFCQKSHLTFFVTRRSKMMTRPSSHHQLPTQTTHAT